MTDYRGARGSNTGDDFHELWAARLAIGLLGGDGGLEALAVEGMLEEGKADTWDGVDCALYFDGPDAVSASRIRVEQLKYSGSSPKAPWTVARLIQTKAGAKKRQGSKVRNASVIARLAEAWKGIRNLRPGRRPPEAALVTNQPVAQEVTDAVARAAAAPVRIPKGPRKANEPDEVKLARASGLTAADFQDFAASLDLVSRTGSRFALEDRLLQAMAAWTDGDARTASLLLRQFIRTRMLPEHDRAPITREAIQLNALGASDRHALFPCPSDVRRTDCLVRRTMVEKASCRIASYQFVCIHGNGGVGKTTALQQVKEDLPSGSLMVMFDCYGGGRYLDPAALRHKPADAFVQLANEVATRLRLPLLLSRHGTTDFPRMFMHRLRHAAETLAAANPNALLVVVVDAADNSVTAAEERGPPESSFVHDFVLLRELPGNVRFVVTARTSCLKGLRLPEHYDRIRLEPFTRSETATFVGLHRSAPDDWIEEFHVLSNGLPRVQSYAFEGEQGSSDTPLERLRPGKSLDDVFEQRFIEALTKNGSLRQLERLCAGLVVLARPVPVAALAAVLDLDADHIRDTCSDLAPGIRLDDDAVRFADEDFEAFVRERAGQELAPVRNRAATWLLSQSGNDQYAAIHVAPTLSAAGRFDDLLALVEREPIPAAVNDAIERREAEVQRLRLALSASRAEGKDSRALRYVLLGAEGIRTDDALRDLLAANPDLAVRFATDTVGRLLLSDPDCRPNHGRLLFHQLVVHAERGDAVSYKEGMRSLAAWLEARRALQLDLHDQPMERWPIGNQTVEADVEAVFKLKGAREALGRLESWRPSTLHVEVGLTLPARLIAEGKATALEEILGDGGLDPIGGVFVRVPLALAGQEIDTERLEQGLLRLSRMVRISGFMGGYQSNDALQTRVVDLLLTGCEILTARAPEREGVDAILARFLEPALRRVDKHHTSDLARLDALFRAFALREARAGHAPLVAEIFEQRPKVDSKPDDGRRQIGRDEADRDRELQEHAGTVFPSYGVVACVLVGLHRGDSALAELRRGTGSIGENGWRLRRGFRHGIVRSLAARQVLSLLAMNIDPAHLMEVALGLDDSWRAGHMAPDRGLVSRLSLRPKLHEQLAAALTTAARAAADLRIGAGGKADTLMGYARLLLSLSPDDAGAVFQLAVGAAGELDTEGRAQLIMLEQLVRRAANAMLDRRETALTLGEVVADAAIRLESDDHFPWDQAMAALMRLDPQLALAAASRWDARGTVDLWQTLPGVLGSSLKTRTLTPGQAAALALMLEHDKGSLKASMSEARTLSLPNIDVLQEEAARDLLLRPSREGKLSEMLAGSLAPTGSIAEGALVQEEFERALRQTVTSPVNNRKAKAKSEAVARHRWTPDVLVDALAMASVVSRLQSNARVEKVYLSRDEILATARAAVPLRDRNRFLDALASLDEDGWEGASVRAILDTLDAWRSPGVDAWSRNRLPRLIKARLPRLSLGTPFGRDELTPLLAHTGLPVDGQRDLLLASIQDNVESLSAETIFALVARVGVLLSEADTADLLNWYVRRLASRISREHLEAVGPPEDLPRTMNEAIARFLVAQMASPDTRIRWRAAHALRRMARTGERGIVPAVVAEHGRQTEPVFSGPPPAYYPLAARLWTVICLDRIAGECPTTVAPVGPLLLSAALDDTFPHLLLRAFARDACRKLVIAGVLTLTPAQATGLARVNEPGVPRVRVENRYGPSGFVSGRKERRFRFDPMNTLPDWYERIMRAFAGLDGARFLDEAERWIVDVWGWDEEGVQAAPHLRQSLSGDRNYALTSHSHGSNPTVEPLDTHLEWHAMWCAAGELLKTTPLCECDPGDWDDLGHRARREQLTEPPLWAADLLVPTPLHPRHWALGEELSADWTAAVVEGDHRLALFPPERADYVVVNGYEETIAEERSQRTRLSSALVNPSTAPSLLRALQTMEDSWDYKLPDEGDSEFEFDEPPHRLIGWLQSPQRDEGIDKHDPYKGYACYIRSLPGNRVGRTCGLVRDATGAPLWSQPAASVPMFIYEAWGEKESDDDRWSTRTRSVGRRLLAHREQLAGFLRSEDLDLVVEVEVTRSGRQARRYSGEEDATAPEGKFDRLYRLDSSGGFHVAEGHIGTWAGTGTEP